MTLESVKAKDGEGGALEVRGRVFDIQRFSIQDGPGIRTTVFLKGCPLTCLWCSNPESQKPVPQLIYFSHLCKLCYRCVDVCPNHANRVCPDGSVEVDRSLCQACGKCVEVCPHEARRVSGKVMTVGEVMEIVRKDAPFYRHSGGGVTASGGEATSQATFLLNLFWECQKRGYHTVLDTCGYVKWEVLEPILEHVDLVLFDVKHTDPAMHKKLTGVSNELILENARRIAAKGVPLILRVPVIPGCTDSEQNIRSIAEFALELGGVEVNLLPYHKLGVKKYEALGMEYKLGLEVRWPKRTPKGKYPKEFREEAVKLVIQGNISVPKAARSLLLPISTLGNWVKAYKADKLRDITSSLKKEDVYPLERLVQSYGVKVKII